MAISKKDRIIIHAKYDGHCAYCGKVIALKDMQVDHMMPQYMRVHHYPLTNDSVWKGEVDHPDNLIPSCRRCNHYKRSDTLAQFRHKMATLHHRIVMPYIHKVALDYGLMEVKPFDGLFYFEKLEREKQNQ